MKAELTWQGGVKFEAVSETGHTVILDGAPESGGENAGMRPMEMVLIGAGGCASFDVVHILKTGREAVDGCVTRLTAERADDPPRVFTKIAMHFVVSGKGLSENKVARAVTLSAEKYCSASIMLGRGGVEITHSYEIVESP
ncbi:MAG: OsmC family protein [Deltaproteobacteria bacterium]|nr:OsmC family protein [Deltaproteobacteria bacterium]